MASVASDVPKRTERFAASGNVTLAADVWGTPQDAPSVVLLHGGGQTRHAWQGTGETLARAGWHVISLDLRGHGDSDWADDEDYSMSAFAGDARCVAESLPQRPVLVGASIGGLSAMLAIGETEHAIASGIVLVDIAARVEKSGAEKILGFMRACPDGFESLEQAADAIAQYLPHRKRPRDTSGLSKNLRLHPDGRYRWHWDPVFAEMRSQRTQADRFPERTAAAASALDVPTLLVRGRMSDLLSEDGAKHFLGLAPHAEFVDVSGAGHMVAGDRNEVFGEAVCGFLEKLPGAPERG